MQQQFDVSVIIPVYKAEPFLDACVTSVLQQKNISYEIILVDDGSPDQSGKMCDTYAAQYQHIKAIHQANAGAGAARNTGIAHAAGKYLYFLDSDDALDGDSALWNLFCVAEESQADITVGCYRRLTQDGISGKNLHHLRAGNYTKTTDFRFKGFYMYGHLAYNWGKLYRSAFLSDNDLKCCTYSFAEDKAHNIHCIVYDPVYAFTDESVCLYRINENSLTFRYKKDFSSLWIPIAEDFDHFLKERGIDRSYPDLTACHLFFGSFFLVKQELQQNGASKIRQSAKKLREYGEHPYVRQQMKILAFGNCLKDVDALSWKLTIRLASILFYLRGYWLFTAAIALLRTIQIDNFVTKSRYKKK